MKTKLALLGATALVTSATTFGPMATKVSADATAKSISFTGKRLQR